MLTELSGDNFSAAMSLLATARREAEGVRARPLLVELAISETSIPLRVANALDKQFGVVWVSQLLQLRPVDLSGATGIGDARMAEVMAVAREAERELREVPAVDLDCFRADEGGCE